MVLIKKSKTFSSLFLIKVSVEIMLSYGLEKKKSFQDDKNVNFKVQKMGFPLPMVLAQKYNIFSNLFLSKNSPRNNVRLWSRKKRIFSRR